MSELRAGQSLRVSWRTPKGGDEPMPHEGETVDGCAVTGELSREVAEIAARVLGITWRGLLDGPYVFIEATHPLGGARKRGLLCLARQDGEWRLSADTRGMGPRFTLEVVP